MYGRYNYVSIDHEHYINSSIDEILEFAKSINSLNAGSKKKTLEAKLESIKKLPKFVNDSGCRYKRHFNPRTLKVWYEMI
ncbi:MAG: hypothetical protein AABW57_00900 [Nanoarchaeota archaeon]